MVHINDIVLSKEEATTLSAILDGIEMGDYYCIQLLSEYDLIREDINQRTLFFKIINKENSEIAYKKWYYISKDIFIDTRNYL